MYLHRHVRRFELKIGGKQLDIQVESCTHSDHFVRKCGQTKKKPPYWRLFTKDLLHYHCFMIHEEDHSKEKRQYGGFSFMGCFYWLGFVV